MTFKAIILLKRREDLSREEFRDWWLNRHRPLALGLPGLRKMAINIADKGVEYDGASELWFDSEEAFAAAYASDHGQKVAADSMSMVCRRDRLLVEEIILKPGSE